MTPRATPSTLANQERATNSTNRKQGIPMGNMKEIRIDLRVLENGSGNQKTTSVNNNLILYFLRKRELVSA
jgi:hypothetical protein